MYKVSITNTHILIVMIKSVGISKIRDNKKHPRKMSYVSVNTYTVNSVVDSVITIKFRSLQA